MNKLLNFIKQKENTIFSTILGIIIGIFACVAFLIFTPSPANTKSNVATEETLEQYPTVYSYGENLKEIYTNPIFGTYIYLCTKNSTNKANVNVFNGIYYEKPTAEVNNNTVQNIFIFDTFPDLEKIKNISDYETLINTIVAQKPIMGFHRCFIKVHEGYYNQAYTYNKENSQYVFYNGAGGNWKAESSTLKDFKIKQFEHVGTWEYKELNTFDTSTELQAKYKTEIEKTINEEFIKAKKEVDNIAHEADKLYVKIIDKQECEYADYTKYEAQEYGLESPIFWLYVKLTEITKKYIDIGEVPATGDYGVVANFIEPTLQKYNISNLKKLTELAEYTYNQQKQIEIKAKEIYSLIKMD